MKARTLAAVSGVAAALLVLPGLDTAAGRGGPLPAATVVPTLTPTPTPSPTQTPTPTPTPAPEPTPRPKTTITLTADRADVHSREKLVLSGRVDPPPDSSGEYVYVSGTTPNVKSDVAVDVGQARVAPDGTWRLVYRPEHNLDYVAHYGGGEGAESAPVRVYADYIPRTVWRRRRSGKIEVAMRLSVTAEVIDYFSGRKVHFYGFRGRASTRARRLLTTRVFYTDPESSNGRAAAYAKRRVRGLRRVRYVFACIPEPRPDAFGRPNDPIQRQCGRRRLKLPLLA